MERVRMASHLQVPSHLSTQDQPSSTKAPPPSTQALSPSTQALPPSTQDQPHSAQVLHPSLSGCLILLQDAQIRTHQG